MVEVEPQSHVDREEGDKNPIAVLFSNFLGAIKPFFTPKQTDSAVEPSPATSKSEEPSEISPFVADDEVKNAGIVTFPRRSFVPVNLVTEAEDAERSTNPVLLWQVYAIGGFFVLRWAWSRWNERKGRKKPDDEPAPPQG